MKKKDAPLAWMFRNNLPFHALLIIFLILKNAKLASAEYRNAKNKPLTIWIIKHNPNNEPKFHK